MNRRGNAIIAGALFTTAAAVLTGCSGGGGASDDELTVWLTTQEGSQADAFQRIVDGFEEENPGVTVKVEQRAVDAHKDALRQSAGTSAGPDVYWYWEGLGLGGELVEVGLSEDLTPYYDEYGWEDRFTPAAMSGVTQYGGFHGVPFTQQAMALFYNKDLFAQAGITELPTDYAGLVRTAETLHEAGITPIEFGGTVNWHIMRLLDSLMETECGAELNTELALMEASWAEQACVDAAFGELATWGENFFQDGYFSMSNEDASEVFYAGDAAMAFEGTWFDQQLVDSGMDPASVGILQFPTGTGRLSGFGEALYMNSASEKKDLAAQFIDYATSDSVQADTAGTWGALSVNASVDPASNNPLHELWIPMFESAEGVYGPTDQNLPGDVTSEYWRVQNSVLTGEIAPDEAGETIQAFIDNTQ